MCECIRNRLCALAHDLCCVIRVVVSIPIFLLSLVASVVFGLLFEIFSPIARCCPCLGLISITEWLQPCIFTPMALLNGLLDKLTTAPQARETDQDDSRDFVYISI
mmetsp:Transcript_29595/g.64347  ORF Transcript_29595/g.64347 Transcript_29595/m.64347 type:complete len:106 (+) Transcript_29595:97-414(+)